MKLLLVIILNLALLNPLLADDEKDAVWFTDYAEALKSSKSTGKPVFAYFTGSNWCGFCKKMQKEILETPQFQNFAHDNLTLLALDFPRPAPKDDPAYELNRWIAEQHGIRGFPTIILLDPDGGEIGRNGYRRGGPEIFLQGLQKQLESSQ